MRVITLGASMLVLALAADVVAAPAADLVVVWAPGARVAPIEQVARSHGAAVIDRSPHPTATAQTAEKLRAAIATYNTLAFQQAKDQLDAVRSEIDANGAAGLSPAQLSDLFIYRGLARSKIGDDSGSFDDLVAAAGIDPARSLDPQVFTPKQIDEWARAKEVVAQRPHGKVTLDIPAGCTATLDAAPATAPIDRVAGYHWVRVACPDREPRGQPLLLTGGDVTVPIQPAPYLPPSDSDLLVQARVAGSRAVIVVEVHGNVGTARLVGLDGRERDRRTVTLGADVGPLADAVGDLLVPPVKHHWYESKWTWAAGGVAAAAIILVPLTAAIAGSGGSSTLSARPSWPTGAPWQ